MRHVHILGSDTPSVAYDYGVCVDGALRLHLEYANATVENYKPRTPLKESIEQSTGHKQDKPADDLTDYWKINFHSPSPGAT